MAPVVRLLLIEREDLVTIRSSLGRVGGHMVANMTATPEDVLSFWLDETEPKDWYAVDEALDATIRERFEATLKQAWEGALSL